MAFILKIQRHALSPEILMSNRAITWLESNQQVKKKKNSCQKEYVARESIPSKSIDNTVAERNSFRIVYLQDIRAKPTYCRTHKEIKIAVFLIDFTTNPILFITNIKCRCFCHRRMFFFLF